MVLFVRGDAFVICLALAVRNSGLFFVHVRNSKILCFRLAEGRCTLLLRYEQELILALIGYAKVSTVGQDLTVKWNY
jgi:hypothetical protein